MVAAGSITVAVRVRPPTTTEAARLPTPSYETSFRGDGALSTPTPVTSTATLRDIVQIVDDRILTFDPPEKDQSRAFLERGFMPPGTKRYKDKRFMFDRVFTHDSRQEEVYQATSQPLLQGLFDGFNATVFAYGATGCGKTHTISGTEADPGIIYLTMADLFQRIEDRQDEWTVEVSVTFLEIYNEEIRDLLSDPGSVVPRGGLQIREDKTVKVAGLVELRPKSAEEVKEIVLQGNLRRTQSPTLANATSSRSHAVLQVHISQAPRTASLTEERTLATLSIIDLAGSERAAATTNMGQRMVEGANINKSLLALGNCINALCENGGITRHVPYRNSKLTRLLKFSLGGNCKTVMIVCIAPTSIHFDDTHNTLLYAERATKIKTKVVTRNVVNVDRHVGRYVEAINRLNIEVAELKAKLAGKLSGEGEITKRKKAECAAEVKRVKADLEAKSKSSQMAIMDAASCKGRLTISESKLQPILIRLAQINNLPEDCLSQDLKAERGLLQALAKPEEDAKSLSSSLNVRLKQCGNVDAMFAATLRAMNERRSTRLDDISTESIQLEARWREADMERIKAEKQLDAVKAAFSEQASVVVSLIGMMGRCTTMVAEASRLLRSAADEAPEGMTATVRAMAISMQTITAKNDAFFETLVGHSTSSYVADDLASQESLDNFKGYATFLGRSSSPAKQELRRNKAIHVHPPALLSPPRRAHRTPRKSLRSNLQPYRRAPDREKEKKVVQWKDEAGQGELDDSLQNSIPVISNSKAIDRVRVTRPPSVGGDSEWEDEKSDENLSISDSGNRLSSASGAIRRPRASRLGQGFLKSKPLILASLPESDESVLLNEHSQPFGSRNGNSIVTPPQLEITSKLHIPKGKDGHMINLSARRISSTPRNTSGSKSRRRLSNAGPMRVRRISSVSAPTSPKNEKPQRISYEATATEPVRTLTPVRRVLRGSSAAALVPLPAKPSKSPLPTGPGLPSWR